AFYTFKEQMIKEGKVRKIEPRLLKRCLDTYGKNTTHIMTYFDQMNVDKYPTIQERFMLAQVHYSVQYESVRTLTDFFHRRTSWLYFHRDEVRRHKKTAALYMKELFEWTKEEQEK